MLVGAGGLLIQNFARQTRSSSRFGKSVGTSYTPPVHLCSAEAQKAPAGAGGMQPGALSQGASHAFAPEAYLRGSAQGQQAVDQEVKV